MGQFGRCQTVIIVSGYTNVNLFEKLPNDKELTFNHWTDVQGVVVGLYCQSSNFLNNGILASRSATLFLHKDTLAASKNTPP